MYTNKTVKWISIIAIAVPVGSIVCVAFMWLVLPTYVLKNANRNVEIITHCLKNRNEEDMKDELMSRVDSRYVKPGQVLQFIDSVRSYDNSTVTGRYDSSDDLIISVLHDNSEAMLVLSQETFLSRWRIVNVRYLKRDI